MPRNGRWLALIAVCLAAHALAAPNPKEFERYVKAGAGLFDAFEYERALESFHRARDYAGSPEDDVTVALYAGICQHNLGHRDEGDAEFRTALYLNLEAQLPRKVSPKVVQAFEAVREDVRANPGKAPPSQWIRPEAAAPPSGRQYFWVPGGLGALIALASVPAFLRADDRFARLTAANEPGFDLGVAARYRDEGNTMQQLGAIALGTGGALLLISGAMFALGGPEEVQPAAALGPNGGWVGVTVRLR